MIEHHLEHNLFNVHATYAVNELEGTVILAFRGTEFFLTNRYF